MEKLKVWVAIYLDIENPSDRRIDVFGSLEEAQEKYRIDGLWKKARQDIWVALSENLDKSITLHCCELQSRVLASKVRLYDRYEELIERQVEQEAGFAPGEIKEIGKRIFEKKGWKTN